MRGRHHRCDIGTMNGARGSAETLHVLASHAACVAVPLGLQHDTTAIWRSCDHIGTQITRTTDHLDLCAAVASTQSRKCLLELHRTQRILPQRRQHARVVTSSNHSTVPHRQRRSADRAEPRCPLGSRVAGGCAGQVRHSRNGDNGAQEPVTTPRRTRPKNRPFEDPDDPSPSSAPPATRYSANPTTQLWTNPKPRPGERRTTTALINLLDPRGVGRHRQRLCRRYPLATPAPPTKHQKEFQQIFFPRSHNPST